MMKKISLIGAGQIGGTLAHLAALKELFLLEKDENSPNESLETKDQAEEKKIPLGRVSVELGDVFYLD